MTTPFFVPPIWQSQFWHEVIKPLITRDELEPVMTYVERTWIGELESYFIGTYNNLV